MPNWCSNEVTIYSKSRDEIENLLKEIYDGWKHPLTDTSWSNIDGTDSSLVNMVMAITGLGVDRNGNFPIYLGNCRGSMEGSLPWTERASGEPLFEIHEYTNSVSDDEDDKVYAVDFFIESTWGSCDGLFEAIRLRNDSMDISGLKIRCVSVECGNGVFVVNEDSDAYMYFGDSPTIHFDTDYDPLIDSANIAFTNIDCLLSSIRNDLSVWDTNHGTELLRDFENMLDDPDSIEDIADTIEALEDYDDDNNFISINPFEYHTLETLENYTTVEHQALEF